MMKPRMDEFVIEGNAPLQGTVTPSGNKNAAFPLIAAALLTDEPVRLRNLPDILDVRTMLSLVEGLGVEVERDGPHAVTLRARRVTTTAPDASLLRRVRGGLVLTGPLLAREGEARLAHAGGDQIGRRRIDTHVLGLQALGASVTFDAGQLVLRGRPLRGADILLDEASVTATENVVLAAALAEGTTVLGNAACEPHVQETCRLLTAMGARIDGIGSNLLRIHGVPRLRGAETTLGPDFMEVGSFLALAPMVGGDLTIKNAGLEHLRMVLNVFGRLGVQTRRSGDDLVVPGGQSLAVTTDLGDAIPRIDDGPWPAFPADLMSVALVLATQAEGTVLFHEKMYESRLFFVDRLIGMGARVVLCDPHRALVHGRSALRGEPLGIPSPDIRAGIALVIAALCADGTTVIRSIDQIDRGYETIDVKLEALGARIRRMRE
jgi:UDP-N-acetylglucosamine 1-carboxyvinyltransferase